MLPEEHPTAPAAKRQSAKAEDNKDRFVMAAPFPIVTHNPSCEKRAKAQEVEKEGHSLSVAGNRRPLPPV
jgi:hypothetical protein